MSSNVENLSPQIIRRISKELQQLLSSPPEGIKIIINEEDITDIKAIIMGPSETPYSGGCFQVKIILDKGFPTSPPRGYFITKIFHPNVGKDGEICVNTLKRDWKSDFGIKHILLSIKCLLIVPNAESALNEEAAKLLLDRYDDYCERVRMMMEIHARSLPKCLKVDACSNVSKAEGPAAKKLANDKAKSSIEGKNAKIKEKKRTLKRL